MRSVSLVLLLSFALFCFGEAKSDVDPKTIKYVDVVFMNHLDVGFDGLGRETGYAINVINKYFDVYFPAAVEVAETLRNNKSLNAQLIYTTHSWLVSIYVDCPASGIPVSPQINVSLHCPSKQALAKFKEAVYRGEISWHAFPFNAEAEFMDSSLFQYGIELTHELDAMFGKTKKNTMSQRDVPGTTRSVIPLLRKQGVKALTIGVNGGSAPPAVPSAFVWADHNTNTDIIGMLHPGGYGGIDISDCVMVQGLNRALAFAFKGDNAGPPSVDEVLADFAQLRKEFPNAQVMASTYDTFVNELEKYKSALPVIREEIGDTWIYGVPSDPLKVAQFRAVLRLRKHCIETGECNPKDSFFRSFDRLLIKNGEHTWGVDTKVSLHDWGNWSNVDFDKAKSGSNYQVMVNSWLEQRAYITNAVKFLGNHDLAKRISTEFQKLVPRMPSTAGYQLVTNLTTKFDCDIFEIGFSSTGGINHLLDKRSGLNWASDDHLIGQFQYQTFDAQDYDTYLKSYGWDPSSYWFPLDFGKPNVELAHPEHKSWQPKVESLYYRKRHGYERSSFIVEISMETEAYVKYGSPPKLFVQFDVDSNKSKIYTRVQWFNKTSTRLPESLWFTYNPVTPQGSSWTMDKLGLPISPLEVVFNGSKHLHGVDRGVELTGVKSKFSVETVDAAVVAAGEASPFPIPLGTNPNVNDYGMSFCLYNNIWGTNYIMWYPYIEADAGSLFRFNLAIS